MHARRAVSVSRISPTRMRLGSWRKYVRMMLAKVSPAASLVCAWVTPSIEYSMGSSMVAIEISGLRRSAIAEYSVVDLPLPVGPVTSTSPSAR